ncbi:hypothetical protein OUZ56_007667 [Daphnia magna]|uniref:Uncharacterized protein n=1 Tax=Daphnia magna TaxID=35525 RepID=A0ABR0AAM2_9CRUS|nr:hypothetical protein OUZ56_007667 [Daphnia magna]
MDNEGKKNVGWCSGGEAKYDIVIIMLKKKKLVGYEIFPERRQETKRDRFGPGRSRFPSTR